MNASSKWKSKLAGVTPPRPDNPSLGEEERLLLQFRFGKEGEISAEGAYIK